MCSRLTARKRSHLLTFDILHSHCTDLDLDQSTAYTEGVQDMFDQIYDDKMLSYRRETALQDASFSPKVEDWNWEYFTDIICLSSTTVI